MHKNANHVFFNIEKCFFLSILLLVKFMHMISLFWWIPFQCLYLIRLSVTLIHSFSLIIENIYYVIKQSDYIKKVNCGCVWALVTLMWVKPYLQAFDVINLGFKFDKRIFGKFSKNELLIHRDSLSKRKRSF